MNNEFKIDNRIIGDNYVYIIAEACDNHLGNMETAEKMIKQSIEKTQEKDAMVLLLLVFRVTGY